MAKGKRNMLEYLIDLLGRYDAGEASQSERKALESRFSRIPKQHLKKKDRLRLETNHRNIWQKLSEKYGFEGKAQQGMPPLRTFRLIAAAICAGILLAGGLWFTNKHTNWSHLWGGDERLAYAPLVWSTGEGQTGSVVLPDGSKIRMDAGSRIKIDKNAFNKTKREIWLSGEAFFEVAKNHQKPFIIHTGEMQTLVRGTSFNLKAYAELGNYVVSVRSGKVEVSEGRKLLGTLTADKELRYDPQSRRAEISEADWKDAAAWIDGRIVLDRADANELCLRLRQHFEVQTVVEGQALAGKYLSGSFGSGSTLTDIMNTIGTIYGIHYQLDGNKLIITP